MSSPGWRFELLGLPAGFAHPGYLALVLAAVLVGGLGLWAALRRRRRLAEVIAPPLSSALAPGLSTGRPAAVASLSGLALVLFAFALAEPQCGGHTELVKKRGIDLVVAVDASKSMLARDVSPSRIARAKLELSSLLDQLKGDRVGIVAFAGDAFIQCPLTSDYAAAKMFLRAIDPSQMQDPGTDIGGALLLSQRMLDATAQSGQDRVVVLLSDGEDLAGDDEDAAKALAKDGIKVYTVGIGSTEGEPIPIIDRHGDVTGYKKDEDGQTVLTRLDRAGLSKLANLTGGEFFYQPHGVAMAQVADKLDRLKKADLGSRVAVRYDEKYQVFALPGLVALILALFLPLAPRSLLPVASAEAATPPASAPPPPGGKR